MTTIESPCIGVCELKDNICIGCNRTVEQITNWETMSEEQKEKVMFGDSINTISGGALN